MRLRDQLLERRRVENLTAHRHPPPHVVEQRSVNLRADRVVSLLEQRVRVGEELVVRGKFLDAEILHPDHAKLLQVRIRVAPAPSLVEPDAVGQDLSERSLRFLQVEAAQAGFEQPLGANLWVGSVEAERTLVG